MSRTYRFSLRALGALGLLALTACGGGDSGPTAHPDLVVRDAPDLTMALGSAKVTTTGPKVTGTGTAVFASGVDALGFAGLDTKSLPWGVAEPVAALDLLRGVVRVKPYGGAEVQGIGSKRYEVDLDLAKAIAATPAARRADLHLLDGKVGKDDEVWADVFIDRHGRVRRILLPAHSDTARPYGDDKSIPQMVTVDFFDFGKGGA